MFLALFGIVSNSSSTVLVVRLSNQMMAFTSGWPVCLSQTTVDSRWLVIPIVMIS